MNFLPLYIYFIALSFLVSLGIYYLPRNRYSYLRLFPPFLLLTVAAESICQYLRHIGENNVVIYNFFSFFEFCFYLWFFSLVVRNPLAKKIAHIALVVYVAVALCNIFLIQGVENFHSNSYCLGCLMVVAFCIYYFLELFRPPQEGSLVKNPAFWICTGLLFFYCCSFPFFGLIHYWSSIPKVLLDNFMLIVNVMNIFLYTFFTIGFLWARTQKYTSSRS